MPRLQTRVALTESQWKRILRQLPNHPQAAERIRGALQSSPGSQCPSDCYALEDVDVEGLKQVAMGLPEDLALELRRFWEASEFAEQDAASGFPEWPTQKVVTINSSSSGRSSRGGISSRG